MAAAPIGAPSGPGGGPAPPVPGGPPPGLGPSGGAPGPTMSGSPAGGPPTPAVTQMLLIIADGVQRLGQSFPPALPMVNQIGDLLNQIQSKVAETITPAQPAAPPV